MMKQESIFFRHGERTLYGMLYIPDGDAADSSGGARRGMVVCDSLFEEKFWCERVFANMGRILAQEGVTVLGFDYFGYGNSAGLSEDVDVNGLLVDINDACNLLKNRGVTSISLLGVRWGGTLACQAAAQRDDVDSLFLINPVAKWKTEFMKALRANVAGQYAIFKKAAATREEIINELTSGEDCIRSGYRMSNIDGYYFSKEFYEQCLDMAVPDTLPDRITSVTVFEIPEKRTSAPPKNIKVADQLAAGGVNCEGVHLPGELPFWRNNPVFESRAPEFYEELLPRIKQLGPGSAVTTAGPQIEVSDRFSRDGVLEQAFSFKNSNGYTLYGVLYLPESGELKDTAFVFSHGGLIGMNGAFRINTRAARYFVKKGHACLCFDPHGMGRAEGTISRMGIINIFREIAEGLLTDDVGLAVSFLHDRIGPKRVILFGVCGGAITNFLSHGMFDSISASIQLSVPVLLPGSDHAEKRMSQEYAQFFLSMYIRKLISPRAWWRFLTFQSDNKNILKAVGVRIQGGLKRLTVSGTQNLKKQTPPSPAEGNGDGQQRKHERSLGGNLQFAGEGTTLNDCFVDTYRKIVERGDPAVFLFGTNDNFQWEYKRDFGNAYPELIEAGKHLINVELIQDANHMYTLCEWQDQILDYCERWIEQTDFQRPVTQKLS